MSRWYAQRFPVPPWRYRLATAAQRRMDGFVPQALANTAWAFAKAGQKNELLFAALATAAQRRMDGFNLLELTNTAWAFATTGHKNE